jgi:cellobiose-specific phosphotransferase system component IIB
VPRGKRFRPVKRANALIAHMNACLRTEKAVRQVLEHIRRLRIDVLLASPQSVFDLTVTVKVVRRSRVPVITWFMDDYFTDDGTMMYQRELWRTSRNCFVISEAMQRRFARLFSKECAVLNNSVPFPDHWPESSIEPHSRLRIIYAGSLN